MNFITVAVLTLSVGVAMPKTENLNLEKTQPDIASHLDEGSKAKLDEIGFVVVPTTYQEIYEVYEDYESSPYTPVFVSADLTFHTFHLMVDYTVRILETEELLPKLEKLTEGMLERSLESLKKSDAGLKDAARAECVYYAVAARLLGREVELPKDIDEMVAKEVAKIEEHRGIERVSFLPDVTEDYSQYVPRGHYTRSDSLKRYFKAMMWYGRLPLNVPSEKRESLLGLQTAALMSLHLEETSGLTELWEDIYEATAFFFGAAEDLTPGLLLEEARDFFKEEPTTAILEDESRMRAFADYLAQNIQPKIISQQVGSYMTDEPVAVPLSVRFMPQRFVPDSYVFTELVADRVSRYRGKLDPRPFTWGMTQLGEMRVFPRGLDIMAVLRYSEALRILQEEGDTDYDNYDEQFEKMLKWYASLSPVEKESSIYFSWFELLALYRKSDAPKTVDETAWERKKILTALGSWTELRHDAILYAKQSYTPLGMAMPPDRQTPPPPLKKSVIEPAPELYSSMAQCARVIADFSTPTEGEGKIREAYSDLAQTLDRMDTLARKERAGDALSAEEHEWLWNLAAQLSRMPRRLGSVVRDETDDRMALVADVHTDPNSSQVLEEATGDPAQVYVVVTIDGKSYVAQGAVYTYYEFKEPISDRLTDEAWQDMLDRHQTPDFPVWTATLLAR